MELLIIFTSEIEGTEKILNVLLEKGLNKGVVIESQGMKKVLGHCLSPDEILGIFSERRAFNRTIMAIVEKENVKEVIQTVNDFWKNDKDNDKKKNRIMFSLPLHNFIIGG